MIVPIKQIITEGLFSKPKPFNVGPSLGQKFLNNVQSTINSKKEALRKEINTLDKLQELRSRPGFGDIAPKQVVPNLVTSSKILPRDKTNPYEQYRF